jgi:predicted nuclease of restriction endonuclease-like RecB superfamily
MLTREHAIADYDFATARVFPDRLTRHAHRQYVDYAERMLACYRDGLGRTRRELHRAVADILSAEQDCPSRRVAAFAKLLDDASDYAKDHRGKAATLRREVFHRAARRHPLVRQPDRLFEASETEVKAEIAAALGQSWEEIEQGLFTDVFEFHRLSRFTGYADGAALLARYNVAQVQAALYGAVSLNVVATRDLKTILRYAKLARLLHSIHRVADDRWVMRFDGPASVLRETQRYGVNLAKFLPALIACQDWEMTAVIPKGPSGNRLRLLLSARDGLRSHLPPLDEFDSSVEQALAERWGAEPREGWSMSRESEILFANQHAFLPDFTFTHADGRRVHLEIVGFWTPEYLSAKAETLRRFASEPILVAVAASSAAGLPELPRPPLVYKTRIKVPELLERLRSTDDLFDHSPGSNEVRPPADIG